MIDYKNKNPNKIIVYRSFIGFKNLESAYLQLLCFPTKIFFLILLSLLVCFVYFSGIELVDEKKNIFDFIIFPAVSLILVKNYFRITYVIGSFFQSLFSFGDIIVIIDDLDRSSLSESDQWAFLANLWHVGHKYIVLLGDKGNRRRVLDKVEKLNGIECLLPTLDETNYKIARSINRDSNFPIEQGLWLSHVKPRQLISIIDRVKEEIKSLSFKDKDEEFRYKVFSYLNKFADVLAENVELDIYDRQTTEFEFRKRKDLPWTHGGQELVPFYSMEIGRVKAGDPPSQKSNPLAKLMIEDLWEKTVGLDMFKTSNKFDEQIHRENTGFLRMIFRSLLSEETLLYITQKYKF